MATARTAPRWLAESIGWVVGSALGVLISWRFCWETDLHGTAGLVLCLGSALGAHALIWWKAVDSSWWRQATDQDELWSLAVAKLWLMLLLVFQVACSYLLVACIGLLLGGNDGSSWGSPKT